MPFKSDPSEASKSLTPAKLPSLTPAKLLHAMTYNGVVILKVTAWLSPSPSVAACLSITSGPAVILVLRACRFVVLSPEFQRTVDRQIL